jgi:hypothetical protein
MIRDTGGGSETHHSEGSDIGRGGPSYSAFEGPVRRRSSSERPPVRTASSEGSGPVKESSDRADSAKESSDSPRPAGRLSTSEVELIGLFGSTKVPALLIPTDRARPIATVEFDLDKICRYEAVRYDKNRVFLTEKHAYLDHLTNSRASDWVLNHSDAAKDPDGGLPSPEKLEGDTYVLARDPIMEWITQSTTELNRLKHALHWIDPLGPTD